MKTIRMLATFFSEFTTQSNTAWKKGLLSHPSHRYHKSKWPAPHFELRDSFYCFQGSEHTKYPKGFNGAEILAGWTAGVAAESRNESSMVIRSLSLCSHSCDCFPDRFNITNKRKWELLRLEWLKCCFYQTLTQVLLCLSSIHSIPLDSISQTSLTKFRFLRHYSTNYKESLFAVLNSIPGKSLLCGWFLILPLLIH